MTVTTRPTPAQAAVAPETLRPLLWLISTLGRAATAVTTKKRRKFRDNSVKLRWSTCPTRNSPGAAGAAAYAFAMAPSLDLAQPMRPRRDSVAARQCQCGPEPASYRKFAGPRRKLVLDEDRL